MYHFEITLTQNSIRVKK